MNSLTASNAPRLPAKLDAEPQMSIGLQALIRGSSVYPGVGEDDPGLYIAGPEGPTEQQIREAKALLEAMRAALAPVTPETILAWVANLRSLPNGPKDDAGVRAAVGLIVLACGDLPAMCWTRETLAQAALMAWFPSPNALDALLRPPATAARRRLKELERVAGSAPIRMVQMPPYVPPPPPEWVGSRDMRKASGPVSEGDARHSLAQLPVRSIEQQLRELGEGNG